MKVVEILSIRGRGATATIDALPEGMRVGSIVTQGRRRWVVTSIMQFRPSDRTPGRPAELELREEGMSAVMPVAERELELETEDEPRRT